MILKKSPIGIPYYQSVPEVPGIYPLAMYAGGGGDGEEKVQYSQFAEEFVPMNKDKFICIAAQLPDHRTGWDTKVNGELTELAHTAHFIRDGFKPSAFHAGGWSAGATINSWYQCKEFLTTLTLAAGGGTYSLFVEMGKLGIPARWYHAKDDGSIPYSKAQNYSAAYGKAMQLITIEKGGHGAAPEQAYGRTENIGAWYLSLSKPVEPPDNSGMDIPIKRAYLSESKNRLVIEFENGKVWEYPPPN